MQRWKLNLSDSLALLMIQRQPLMRVARKIKKRGENGLFARDVM